MDLNKIILGKNLKKGDKVKVLSNYNNHNYNIGDIYTISHIDPAHGFLLASTIPHHIHPHRNTTDGWQGNWITSEEFSNTNCELSKEYLVNELKVFLEFLEDYEDDVQSSDKFEKEFKVYKILKEIKGSKSDFEKIKIISAII